MTKKEYILKILESLKYDWPIAKGLGIVIWELNDEKLLDAMYKIFNKAIKNISDKKTKDKLYKSISSLKKLREKEQNEKNNDLKDLEILEKQLENLF